MEESPYTGPRISRNVAELLGIPLDDPDVEPEVEVFDLSDQEWQAAKNRALASVGVTYEELERQARDGRFDTFKHRKLGVRPRTAN